jgi:Fur family ferric uptake transcriptional regulator
MSPVFHTRASLHVALAAHRRKLDIALDSRALPSPYLSHTEIESQYRLERRPVHAADRFAQYLSKNRLKMTRERRGILDKVLTLRGHFDVEQLLAHLNRSGLPVSRATLYRTLPRLEEAGLVHKVEMGDGQARYEPMFGRHHHDHMTCLGCGKIIEFESREIERLQEDVCRKKKFRMTDHTLQIRGYCAKCG